MFSGNKCAKINIKLLIILTLVVVAVGTSLFAARHYRRGIISQLLLVACCGIIFAEDFPKNL